jgi:diguanylate cyclase (GGDEF)-like protein
MKQTLNGVSVKKNSVLHILISALPVFITIFIATISLLLWRYFTSTSFAMTVIKEFFIACLIGIAVYFFQKARQHAKNLEHMAVHDSLTGLPNRVSLIEHIEHAIARAERAKSLCAVLFFDLNRFKAINDSLGHPVGDALLKSVVERLKALIRREDTLARLGGDEFVLLLTDFKKESDILMIAEKQIAAFSEPFHIESHELHMACSIGISLYPKDGRDADTLIKHADIAMYNAKKNQLPFQFFMEQTQHQIIARLNMENELRTALKKNEFTLHYQPLVHIQSKKITSVEALLRWHSSTQGWVSPSVFIPILEDTGMIVEVGEWILRTACSQTQEWKQRDILDIYTSVNISERQIKQPNFYDHLVKILQESSLAPASLALELTEKIVMEEKDKNIPSLLKKLKELQVHLSIDDFGIEYSSLSRLRNLPADRLKIDQSFLKHLTENEDDRVIVSAIMDMAKHLNLRVVGEGVETKEQLQFLWDRGCDEIQGFLFSGPLEAQQLELALPEIQKKIDAFL